MRKFLLLFVAVCMAVALTAAPRTQEAARRVAAQHLPNQSALRLAKTISKPTDNKPAAYIYTGQEQGFAIISSDSNEPAVLAYSETGTLDVDNMPVQLQAILEAYSQQSKNSRPNLKRAPSRIVIAPEDTVAPMLDCEWSQNWPYNTKVPTYQEEVTDEQGNTTTETRAGATGCVATALAQVLYYHRWPEQGQGGIHYISTPRQDDICVDFSATTYRWDLMHPTYSYDSTYTQDELDAIGTIMYHCGAGVRAGYNDWGGTGASMYAAMRWLKANMYYSDSTRYCVMDEYEGDWNALLRHELQMGRPIPYANYGHAWVIDGLNSQGYFHMNLGWGGGGNGWYYFNLLDITPFEDGINNVIAMAIVGAEPRHRAPGAVGPDTLTLYTSEAAELATYQLAECSENFYSVSGYVDNTVSNRPETSLSFHVVGEPGCGYNPENDLYVENATVVDGAKACLRIVAIGRLQRTEQGGKMVQAEVRPLHRDTISATVAEVCEASWTKDLGPIEHDYAVSGYVYNIWDQGDGWYSFYLSDSQDTQDGTFRVNDVYYPAGLQWNDHVTVAGETAGTPRPSEVNLFACTLLEINGGSPAALENQLENATNPGKFLKDGRLFIRTEQGTYDVLGNNL